MQVLLDLRSFFHMTESFYARKKNNKLNLYRVEVNFHSKRIKYLLGLKLWFAGIPFTCTNKVNMSSNFIEIKSRQVDTIRGKYPDGFPSDMSQRYVSQSNDAFVMSRTFTAVPSRATHSDSISLAVAVNVLTIHEFITVNPLFMKIHSDLATRRWKLAWKTSVNHHTQPRNQLHPSHWMCTMTNFQLDRFFWLIGILALSLVVLVFMVLPENVQWTSIT